MFCHSSIGGASRGSGNSPVLDFHAFVAYLRVAGLEDLTEEGASQLYMSVGFQRLAPYLDFLLGDDVPLSSRTVPALQLLIDFDREVRLLLLRGLDVVETQFKAQYQKAMLDAHGAYCLYDESCFRRGKERASTLWAIEAELKRQARSESNARRGLDRLDGSIPIWLAVDIASFGTVRRLYGNTADSRVVKRVARSFGVNNRCLDSWLRTLAFVRNCCAHCNPYVVRTRIPAIPKSVYGVEGDNTSPLYAISVVERLLAGRLQAGVTDSHGDYVSFRDEATRVVGSFAWEHPQLAVALRMPCPPLDRYAQPFLPVVSFAQCVKTAEARSYALVGQVA